MQVLFYHWQENTLPYRWRRHSLSKQTWQCIGNLEGGLYFNWPYYANMLIRYISIILFSVHAMDREMKLLWTPYWSQDRRAILHKKPCHLLPVNCLVILIDRQQHIIIIMREGNCCELCFQEATVSSRSPWLRQLRFLRLKHLSVSVRELVQDHLA